MPLLGLIIPRRLRSLILVCCAFAAGFASAAEPARKSFNLPSAAADQSLKLFSQQSGVQVLFVAEITEGVRTNAVRGEFTPIEAAHRLFAGTPLRVVTDEKTGVLSVARRVPENERKNGQGVTPSASVRPETTGQTNSAPARDEAVVLTAFEVTADPEDSYEAANTSGVTGTNRSIRSLPITMNVFNRTFIDEINATDITDLMNFTPNVTFSLDATTGGNESSEQYRLRGLTSKEERRRNGFLSLAKSDTFSTERVEMLRGAQALLQGQGVSSGAVNTVTKRAVIGRFGEMGVLFSDVGSARLTLDYNDSRGPYSVRVAGLIAHQKTWQANLKDDPRGAYIEMVRRFGSRLTLRANHEYIEVNSRTRNQASEITLRDNSARDPRAGRTLGSLIYTGVNVSDIVIGGEPLTYENFRSSHSIVTGTRQFANTTTVALEGALTPRLSARVAWNLQDVHIHTNRVNSGAELLAPGDSNAVNGQWTARIEPVSNRNFWHIWSGQAAAVYQFDLGRVATNQVILGGEERLRSQMFAPQKLYAVDAAGNLIAGTGSLGRKPFPTQYVPVQHSYPRHVNAPSGYRWEDDLLFNAVPATLDNPRGLGGSGGALTNRVERQLSGYINWLGNWYQDRVETMIGARVDHVKLENAHLIQTITDKTAKSGIVGAVYNFKPSLGIYANGSKSFAAAGTLTPTVDNEFPQPGVGTSQEAGLKFDLFRRGVSGSLAFYDNESGNEAVNVPAAARDAVDPAGINGRNGGMGSVADVRARGVELVLTAQPARGWRVFASLGTNDAYISSPYSHAIFYNDQFNTDGTTVKVRQPDGTLTDLLVPSVRTNASSPRIPLTLAMLRDAASPYRATLDPVSGRITNAAALFLTTPGVGTGVTGLPISSHQLGFVAPNNGIFDVYKAGDKTTPNAGFTVTTNVNYTFESGTLGGFSAGATGQWRNDVRKGYATVGGTRQLYFLPDSSRYDLRVGYRLKLRKTSWNFQFTIQNLLDDQPVEATLAANGGISVINISQAPRTYLLSLRTRL